MSMKNNKLIFGDWKPGMDISRMINDIMLSGSCVDFNGLMKYLKIVYFKKKTLNIVPASIRLYFQIK